MNLSRLMGSFKYACRGIGFVFRHEQNFRLQVYTSVLVFFLAWFFNLRKYELIVILLLIFLVLVLELLNSALEKFADVVSPRLSGHIEIVKDIMAAMVLVSSLGSLAIGLIIFIPYFQHLLISLFY